MIDHKELATRHRFHSEKDWTQKKRNLTRTANSLASAIRSNDLELTPEEQRALTTAYGVLERGCAIYGKTAAIAKQNAANRAKRMEQAKALVKARFASLESTTDRVAFIAASLSYSFAPDSPAVLGLMEAADKIYWAKFIHNEIFDDAMEHTAYRVGADDQPQGLSECVDKYWDRFQELRPSLLQKHARIIVLVQEALAAARS